MNSHHLDLLLGTANRAKAAEIRRALRDLGIRIHTLEDLKETEAVDESGVTYEENAILKAKAYAKKTSLWTLADDSGLEVDALDGAPGVFSARFAGLEASDRDRIDFLLAQLGPSENRAARFVSVVVLCDPDSRVVKVESGICEGAIIDSPRGTNGFGYDPIFAPRGFKETFGELSSDIKDAISHRARALLAMRAFLTKMIAGG